MSHVYAIVTERIMQKLEQGVVPWHKPWEQGIPRNLVSGKPYRGVNVFLTASAGFPSPYWLSFKQCKELHGSVKAGEKGTPVIFWKWLEVDDTESEGDTKQIPLLRYYTVFNLEQCIGIKAPAERKRPAFQPLAQCEHIVANMPQRSSVRHGEPRAYYQPLADTVNMPKPELFDGPEEYYSTLFHELTHSTGHRSRLHRKGLDELAPFGSPAYSKEELVAEMGAAFLCGASGIDSKTVDNSAAYIASWLRVLGNDKQMVVLAAAQAQRSADFIQGVTYQD
jgi:antirestriction protein ArdC